MNSKWIEVMTNPLGLAGFALFLVFTYFARDQKRKRPAWVTSALFAMAGATLLGGLTLGYLRRGESQPKSSMTIGNIDQRAADGSNVAGVQGDVNNQNGGGQQSSKPPKKQ